MAGIAAAEDGLEAREAGPGEGSRIVDEDDVGGVGREEDLVPTFGVGRGGEGDECNSGGGGGGVDWQRQDL